MTLTRRKQLVFVAAIMMVAAVSSLGWWVTSSPLGVRRTAEAAVILFTGVCALAHTRRMVELRNSGELTDRGPLMLASALVALAVTVISIWR